MHKEKNMVALLDHARELKKLESRINCQKDYVGLQI
jgi:hypothetical protein